MRNGKKIVALLPMKLNSIRVKGKNFRDIAGKPLFKWMLDVLLDVEFIDQVVINTDASELLKEKGIVDSDKILIRERKEVLRGDLVSMNLIIADDINDVSSDIYLMTHTTNPLLSKKTIVSAIDRFDNSIGDSLFTVNKVQSRFYYKDSSPINHDPDNLIRTQDLEAWYMENSCLYIFTKESFLKTNARIGKKPIMHEISTLESIDIDNEEDWIIAESLLLHAATFV